MINLKNLRAVLATSLLLAFASPTLADRLDEIKSRGKLLVGVSETTPPFSFRRAADGTLAGYDLDLVRAVAKRLGVALEMLPLASAERIPLLKDGKLDFVATSMTRTPERLREVDFSHIYFVTPHAVIVKKSSGIASVREFSGRKASAASQRLAAGGIERVTAISKDSGRTTPPASRAPLLK